jgi:energy-coupling factor transporter ATP-binding protein EcfA2
MSRVKRRETEMDLSKLQRFAHTFVRELSSSPELKAHAQEHETRRHRAQTLLTTRRISKLSEDDIRALFFDSDAFNYWTNKDWEFNQRLQRVGLNGLRASLRELVNCGQRGLTAEDLTSLWSRRGVGKVLCAELLCYRFPERYWTWGKVVENALKYFGVAANFAKRRSVEQEAQLYFVVVESMELLRHELQAAGIEKADYLHVDLFLWWVQQPQAMPATQAEFDALRVVGNALAAQGLCFSDRQIATFWTALQTKGLVLLSGISGTGKTKLAQHFAALLPQPSQVATRVPLSLTIDPATLKSGRLVLHSGILQGAGRVLESSARDVVLTYDGHSQNAQLIPSKGEWHLTFRGGARQWLHRNVEAGEALLLEPEIDEDRDTLNFRLFAAPAQLETASQSTLRGRNLLFMPVRPDWYDSKALLGYYNPLTARYESTPFLEFVQQAAQSYRVRDGLAWFVLLDEMNLARVEHYFADLLSVLESGRDEAGWTREPLRFVYPQAAEGEVLPRELYLPPNLYFIGTLNLDETTYSISPKVLDRAWTLLLQDVDFRNYPPAVEPKITTTEERRALLQLFTREGRFARQAKSEITEYLQQDSTPRGRLQTLNDLLRPHGLHFGYRTFDEIVWFLQASTQNRFLDNEAAFDVAVQAKILAKFHGSRSRLDAPLRALLAWCLNPDAPDVSAIERAMQNPDAVVQSQLPFRLPQTGQSACCMWRALQNDGYAVFGAG